MRVDELAEIVCRLLPVTGDDLRQAKHDQRANVLPLLLCSHTFVLLHLLEHLLQVPACLLSHDDGVVDKELEHTKDEHVMVLKKS